VAVPVKITCQPFGGVLGVPPTGWLAVIVGGVPVKEYPPPVATLLPPHATKAVELPDPEPTTVAVTTLPIAKVLPPPCGPVAP
jgi:hypothetical protein